MLWLNVLEDKDLGWKKIHGIQIIGIEASQGRIVVDQRQILKILENYVTELYDWSNQPEKLEVEIEEEIDADVINLCILRREVQRTTKEMRDTKVTRDNNVCGDRLKFLGEYSLQLMAQLFSNICETEEWLKDFIEVTMSALKGSPKATKCSHHYTDSFITFIQHKLYRGFLEEGPKRKLRLYL